MTAGGVDCPHWSDCGVSDGGCCKKGLFGGKPSRGTCHLICLGIPVPPQPNPDPPSRIPLAGDLIEAITKRIGADRLAKLWEKWTGQPCGCEERKERLNRATERLVKWLKR